MFEKLKFFFGVKKPLEYKCSSCDKTHANWPALGYSSPVYYSDLSADDKNGIAELSSDFCVIKNEDQTDRFIRGVLKVPVIDSCQDLEYGLWFSLSEKSFEDYKAKYYKEDNEDVYFGCISNNIEGYKSTIVIPCNVCVQMNGLRPLVIPHESHDHPLVSDFYNGISIVEAEKRINALIQQSR